MKFFFGLIIGVLAAVGIAAAAVYYAFGDLKSMAIDIGDRDRGEDVTRSLDLADFDRIDIGGVYELEVDVGGAFSVELSGPEDEMARVEAEVVDGELRLDQRDRERGERRIRNQDGITAKISMPSLVAVEVSGVVDGDISGVDSETFDIDISGVGEMDIVGACGALTADVSGVGDLDARELQCKSVRVRVSGVGEATVYASESVDASISGIGDIDIYGSPSNVKKDKGMFSDISVH